MRRFAVDSEVRYSRLALDVSTTIRAVASRFGVFLRRELWSPTFYERTHGLAARAAILVCRASYIVLSGFRRERIKLRAAALTYMSLLSLVPALAVGFSIFAAFGGLADVKPALQRAIVDALSVTHREKITEFIDVYVGNVHAGRIGGFGVAILLFTVVSLLGNIERSFNDIWGLHRDRTFIQRFQVYWPLITLGPVLLGLSLSVGTGVQASETFREWTSTIPGFGFMTSFGPFVLACAFFSFLYKIMPNTRVPTKFAVLGGVVAGGLWVVAQTLFGIYAGRAVTYSSIYGQLAAVPLFILWIYVSWIVTLAGAQLAFAAQSARTYEPEGLATVSFSLRELELSALRLMMIIALRFERNGGPTSETMLRSDSGVAPKLAAAALESLVASGLLLETRMGSDEEVAYVPGRPSASISVADVLFAMRDGVPEEGEQRLAIDAADAAGRHLIGLLDTEKAAVKRELGAVQLVEEARRCGDLGA